MDIEIRTTKYSKKKDNINFFIEVSTREEGQSLNFYMWISEEKARRFAEQILNRLEKKPHIVKSTD